MKKLFIGTSGWSYSHWRGKFYPADTAQKDWLSFYAAKFETVEINTTFYRLPGEASLSRWRDQTPAGFVFAVKASRYLTHIKKLADPQEPWDHFHEAVKTLGAKLGPILFQFPADWRVNLDRLNGLLGILPKGRRAAFEFRHPSWLIPEVYSLLRQKGAAVCRADSPQWPTSAAVTADFVYIRLHAGTSLFGSRYTAAQLRQLAATIQDYLRRGLDAYVYFNNDFDANAVANAGELRDILGDI